MNRRQIEQAAREAGPWTDEAAQEAARLRALVVPLTRAQADTLRVLRQREINEVVRLHRAAQP